MKQFLLVQFILFTFIVAREDGDVVKNVTAAQRTDGSGILDITYNLLPLDLYPSYFVSVTKNYFGEDGAECSDCEAHLPQCWGDVGYNVISGNNKSIHCQLTGSISSDYIIEVNARGYRAAELPASIQMATIPIDYENDNNLLTGSYNTLLDNSIILNGSLAELINYGYEMMTHEVTALQYVQFLNQFIASAEVEDHTDMVPGYFMYTLADGRYMTVNGMGEISGTLLTSSPSDSGQMYPQLWMILQEPEEGNNFATISMLNYPDEFAITPGYANHPVNNIYEAGAQAFSEFYGLRIPFTYEWLCAAGTIDFEGDFNLGPDGTVVVGSYQPNANGLYDMVGNVGELAINTTYYWSWNFEEFIPWTLNYFRMGGSWYYGTVQATTYYSSENNGFRCVRTLPGSSTE